VKGARASVGCSFMADLVSQKNNPYVQFYIDEGAIPIVKSNVPQGLISNCTMNEIYGVAKNPYNQERTTGGSSGGEAGLAAASCTVFGIGTDIGGSIRMPCSFCGVKGMKFTSERATGKGKKAAVKNSFTHYPFVNSSLGPISKNMDDLITLSRIFLTGDANAYDPSVPPGYFNEQMMKDVREKKIRVGYYESLEIAPATLPVQRAVKVAKEALEDQGYELVPFKLSLEEQKEA